MRRSGKRRRLHPEKARGNCFAFAGARGFARPDLAATVGVAIILLLFFGAGRVGERGRTARCAANLAALGRATQSFADDHEDALPPAAIEPGSVAWDAQVAPYLPPNRVKKGMGPSFQCPSDPLADARARSYAMSAHDMQPENWPPGPDNVTGVGLVWNKESMDRLLDEEHRKMAVSDPDSLALMKRESISAPSGTLVLTEMISAENNLKETAWAGIGGPGPQLDLLLKNHIRIHAGYFNYVMLDGHVELQTPLQGGATSGGLNIWNINKAN
jgi:prepilin-type processing-associated H-X9-DG protein